MSTIKNIKSNREFLKSGDWNGWERTETDQRKKIPKPEFQKSIPADAIEIDLIDPANFTVGNVSLLDAINKRRSRRKYTPDFITLEELSFLLWATQGIKKDDKIFRTVPSGGARHPFETYLFIQRVRDVKPGLYRYLPLEHKLLFLAEDNGLAGKVTAACNHQEFVGESAVTFIWTAVPYRTEWRYDVLSHKVIAIEAGHVCQNLYLVSESINCGTCGIGAYDQGMMDQILGVDGSDEFTIYIAPVGRIEKG